VSPRKSTSPSIKILDDGKMNQAEVKAVLNDVTVFAKELESESDRAAAVLSAAYLDLQLFHLLSAFLVDNSRERGELLGNEYSGGDKPLGTFSARIRASYCLGLIGEIEHHDLDLIRRIRNEFAHQLHGLTFESDQIKGRCIELHVPMHVVSDYIAPARQLFNMTSHLLAYTLITRNVRIQHEGLRRAVPAPYEPLITPLEEQIKNTPIPPTSSDVV